MRVSYFANITHKQYITMQQQVNGL